MGFSGSVAVMFSVGEILRKPSVPSSSVSFQTQYLFVSMCSFSGTKLDRPEREKSGASSYFRYARNFNSKVLVRSFQIMAPKTSLFKEENPGREHMTVSEFFLQRPQVSADSIVPTKTLKNGVSPAAGERSPLPTNGTTPWKMSRVTLEQTFTILIIFNSFDK